MPRRILLALSAALAIASAVAAVEGARDSRRRDLVTIRRPAGWYRLRLADGWLHVLRPEPLRGSPDRVAQLRTWAAALDNRDIAWPAYPGLMPATRSEAAERLRQANAEARPLLFEALDNPRQFAAAHILMGGAFYPQRPGAKGGPGDLGVIRQPDGSANYDAAQMPPLHDYWHARQDTDELVRVPCAAIAVVAAWPCLRWARTAARRFRGRRRAARGLCARCGYDLRGSEERCPECGTMIAVKPPCRPRASG